MDTVGDSLAATGHRDPEWKAGVVGTILLHVGVGAALLVASRIPPPHHYISTQAVAVRLVPLASVRGARTVAVPEPPVSQPVIEKPEDVPAPSPKALPLPEKQKNKKETLRRSIRRRPRRRPRPRRRARSICRRPAKALAMANPPAWRA
jgi:hypothetical protein